MDSDFKLFSDHFHRRLHWPGGLSKDPTVWLNGARPPLNVKLNEFLQNLTNSVPIAEALISSQTS